MDTASRSGRAARLLALAGVAFLVLTTSALAGGSSGRLVRTDAGMTAATAAVLTAHDLGSGQWKGALFAQPQAGTLCAGPAPKTAPVVVNGAAASEFHGPGMKVESRVLVFQTAGMVRRDLDVANPQALVACVRSLVARQLEPNEKLVSVAARRSPGAGQLSMAVRATIAVRRQSGPASQIAIDAILLGAGRAEGIALVTSPVSPFVDVWEQQLAETFAGKLTT